MGSNSNGHNGKPVNRSKAQGPAVAQWAERIIARAGDAMHAIQTARFTFGAIFVALTDAERAGDALTYLGVKKVPEKAGSMSMTAAAEALHAQYPDADARTGYAFTLGNLKKYRDAYLAFADSGGLRHGHHTVADDDVAQLGLTPSEQTDLAQAMATGDVKVKQVLTQAARVRRDPKTKKDATNVVRKRLANARREPSLEERIEAAQALVAKHERALNEARAELEALESQREVQPQAEESHAQAVVA